MTVKTGAIKPAIISPQVGSDLKKRSYIQIGKMNDAELLNISNKSGVEIFSDNDYEEAKAKLMNDYMKSEGPPTEAQAKVITDLNMGPPAPKEYCTKMDSPEYVDWKAGRKYVPTYEDAYADYGYHEMPVDGGPLTPDQQAYMDEITHAYVTDDMIAHWASDNGIVFGVGCPTLSDEIADMLSGMYKGLSTDHTVEDKCGKGKLQIKHPVNKEDVDISKDIKVSVDCSVVKKARELQNKAKLDKLSEATGGMADACGFSNYNPLEALDKLMNGALAGTLLGDAIVGMDSAFLKGLKCFKSILNTGKSLQTVATGAMKFASQGQAGMMNSAAEFSGVNNIVKPVVSAGKLATKADPFSLDDWSEFTDFLDKTGTPKEKMVNKNTMGLTDGLLDRKKAVDVIHNKSMKHYDTIPPDDFKMIKALNMSPELRKENQMMVA